jgi:hypothetical protein
VNQRAVELAPVRVSVSNVDPFTRRERGLSFAAAFVVVAIGAMAGLDLFGRRLRIDARSDWETLSPDLREAGREGALAGPGQLCLRIPGLDPRDSVELTLVSRPGLGPLRAEAFRDPNQKTRASVAETPATLRLPPAAVPDITLQVEAAPDAPRRPVYLFHLLEIAVVRTGKWSLFRPWIPAFVGLAVYWLSRRRAGWARAPLRALFGVTLAIALIPDTVGTVASHGRWMWLTGLIVLLGLSKLLTQPDWRLVSRVALGAGLALFVAVMAHAPRLNGPASWEWPWQRLDWFTTFSAVAVGSAPLFTSRALRAAGGTKTAFLLALLSAGALLSAAAAMVVQPTGLDRMHSLIESSVITSYYTDAIDLASQPDWLASYSERLPSLHLHTKTKPAGPVLFYVALIRAFGPGSATAAAAALLIALGAALAPPAVYLLARELGETADSAYEAACVMALSPSLLIFFPEFDQAFPLMTCLLVGAWSRAMKGSLAATMVVGVGVAIATFFSYSLMTIGIAGLVIAWSNPRRAATATLRVGCVAFVLYAALYFVSGFDPVATFRAALANQARSTRDLGRHYLGGLLSDPWDFAMGAGWLASLLAATTVMRAFRRGELNLPVLLAVLQIGFVHVSGLLSIETARVWLFLIPFVAIPAGRELAACTPPERTAVYVTMALLFAAVTQNMTFLF